MVSTFRQFNYNLFTKYGKANEIIFKKLENKKKCISFTNKIKWSNKLL